LKRWNLLLPEGVEQRLCRFQVGRAEPVRANPGLIKLIVRYNATAGACASPVPEHPFEPWDDYYGFGAWEMAARYSTVNLNSRFNSGLAVPDGVGGGRQTIYAGQLLDQMFLGRSLRGVFGNERGDQGLVFVRVFPWQHGVARQHAMAQGVETGNRGAGKLNRHQGLRIAHRQ
jgi:hypothetical protein